LLASLSDFPAELRTTNFLLRTRHHKTRQDTTLFPNVKSPQNNDCDSESNILFC
jgi:hypothetical protein